MVLFASFGHEAPKKMSLFISQAWQKSCNLQPNQTHTPSSGPNNHKSTVLNSHPEISVRLASLWSTVAPKHIWFNKSQSWGTIPSTLNQIPCFSVLLLKCHLVQIDVNGCKIKFKASIWEHAQFLVPYFKWNSSVQCIFPAQLLTEVHAFG